MCGPIPLETVGYIEALSVPVVLSPLAVPSHWKQWATLKPISRFTASGDSQVPFRKSLIEFHPTVTQINESLTQIDYNPGRYIELQAQPTQDAEIRDFQTELRTCTEGTLTGSEHEQYSENKFLQVRNIINRFR